MTRNQIEYWRLSETRRANRAIEQHNRNVLAYNYAVLEETKRSNLAREAETSRSNRARETQNRLDSDRNLMFQLRQMNENERANRAKEKISSNQLDETIRSNKANELIRANQASAQLMNAMTQSRSQAETERSNRERESLGIGQLAETKRSNIANEGIKMFSQREVARSNQANEAIKRRQNQIATGQFYELQRHNVVTEEETRRSNIMSELNKQTEISMRSFTEILKSIRPTVSLGGR